MQHAWKETNDWRLSLLFSVDSSPVIVSLPMHGIHVLTSGEVLRKVQQLSPWRIHHSLFLIVVAPR